MSTATSDAVGLLLLLAITAYSTAGGVDFGAGIWDLLAGDGPRGRQARALIDHAMAPVWEVNNVWLVLGIVVCWTGFPVLFQAVFASLYPLFAIALMGLILRGSFFAFRHVADQPRTHRAAGLVFGLSSLITPFFFAAALGAIASGRVGPGGPDGSVWEASFNPMSMAFGAVSVAATAFSGASFLVGDARRFGAIGMAGYFSRRAIVAAVTLILLGTVALGVIGIEAPNLLRAILAGRGAAFALVTVLLTPTVVVLLWRGVFRWFRVLTVLAVASMVLAWGLALSPYVIPGRMTIAQAAAPASTLALLLIVAVAMVVFILPGMALLYYLDQKGALESPGG